MMKIVQKERNVNYTMGKVMDQGIYGNKHLLTCPRCNSNQGA